MENASKALIMAAGVLISIMILGALILTFQNMSNYQDTNVQNTREAQVVEFNNQYETYNRDDVRGSDLYSLFNKVVDYNRRKSEVATGTDEGQDLKFQAMTIKVEFPDQQHIKDEWTFDGEIRLFKSPIINGKNLILNQSTSNTFYDKVSKQIQSVENEQPGVKNLASGISNLYPATSIPTEKEKDTAVSLYRNSTGEKKAYEQIQNDSQLKDNVCTYYEYIQFKRAHFKCTYTKYNQNTGRIIELDFEWNPNKTD